jgi:hypothetical protein
MKESKRSDIVPIFVFSLPRAGSTLVQRVLTAHPNIQSTAEPWILLPLVYSLKTDGIYTEYAQCIGSMAIHDFVAELPNGKADYYAAVRELALRMYRGAGGNEASHFVDKTPRYHLIASELLEIFPEAKCILLWRNPLAIVASILKTWGNSGRWNIYRYNVDLYKGLENLISVSQRTPERFLQIRYEDITSKPTEAWQRIFNHLNLEFVPSVLEKYQMVSFSGRMGDPTGHIKFRQISPGSINSWPAEFDNPLRKRWATRYLNWIGDERINTMGYNRDELLHMLNKEAPHSLAKLGSDAAYMALGMLHAPMDLSGLKRQLHLKCSDGRCYAAT